MYAKVEIKGTLEVLTGMHIGGSSAFAAVGAVDSPVVRDTLSDLPMIPGSSLKGKLRALLAQKYNETPVNSCEEDHPNILRLFGSASKPVHRSRLIFRDMILDNLDELREQGVRSATEVKFENGIHRLTAVANPRQIERTIRGSRFRLSVIYDASDPEEMLEDIQTLTEGLCLLQYDYLGGHGSRGYGKVCFSDLALESVVGEVESSLLKRCQKVLEGV